MVVATHTHILVAAAVWVSCVGSSDPPTHPPLLVILLDGVRWDYLNLHRGADLPGFQRFASEGVMAAHLNPVFPANSLPNWHTIVTGLYPENHGIVGNYMYDEERGQQFDFLVEEQVRDPAWWQDTEPLWTTASRNHRDTAMFHWSRCDVPFGGVKPKYCTPYQYLRNAPRNTLRDHLRQAVSLIDKQGFQLAMVYDGRIDTQGHLYGPFSSEVGAALKIADDALRDLWDDLSSRNLIDKVNVVVLSDHGMAWVGSGMKEQLEVAVCWDPAHILRLVEYGGYMNIQPREGYTQQVVSALRECQGIGQHIEVFLKDEVPQRYHYARHHLILDVLVVAKQGYFMSAPRTPYSVPSAADTYEGHHGLDNTQQENREMRGILYARGPSFKSGASVGEVNMVDVYGLLCHALDLPCHAHNGTAANITPFFVPESSHAAPVFSPANMVGVVLTLLLTLFLAFARS